MVRHGNRQGRVDVVDRVGRIRHPIVHEKARYEEAAVVVGPLNHKEEE